MHEEEDHDQIRLEVAISESIERILRSDVLLPVNPLKLLAQRLMRNEVCFEKVAINPLNYLSFPKHEMSLSIKIVRLGATDFYATKQLLPFVSTNSLQQAKHLHHLVRVALGSQPIETKTETINARFVESIAFKQVLSWKLHAPRLHRLNIGVDGIIRAKSFDDSLHIFVRRVLEDAHNATVSSDIVSAHLHLHSQHSILRGGNLQDSQKPQILDIAQMRDKRPQILTMLKATASENGLIELHFYLRTERILPLLDTSSPSHSSGKTNASFATFRKATTGYIQVKITYRLTYQDGSDPSRTKMCTHLPLQTLATSVFMSLDDAQRYLQAYMWFIAAQNKKGGKSSNSNSFRIGSEYAKLIAFQARVVCRYLRQQEFLEMCESLLLLQILLQGDYFRATNNSNPATNNTNNNNSSGDDREAYIQAMQALSYPVVQLTFAMKSWAAQLRAMRDAFISALAVIKLLEISVLDHPTMYMHFQGLWTASAAPQEEQNDVGGIFIQLSTLWKVIDELRHLLQELCHQPQANTSCKPPQQHVHLYYLRHWLMSRILSLYDTVNPSQPLLPQDKSTWEKMDQIQILQLLGKSQQVLSTVESTLKQLEVNVLMEKIGYLLGQDVGSYSLYQQTLILEAKSASKGVNLKVNQFQKVSFPLLEDERDYKDVPRCFLDSLSYALYQAQYRHQEVSENNQSIQPQKGQKGNNTNGNNKSTTRKKKIEFGWYVFQLHPSIREENDSIVANILGNVKSSQTIHNQQKQSRVGESETSKLSMKLNHYNKIIGDIADSSIHDNNGQDENDEEDEETVKRTIYSNEKYQIEWNRLWQATTQRPSTMAMAWDFFGYLGMYDYSKYGGIMKQALQWNEAYHRDVPRSIIAEASLVRYLTESHVMGMISRSMFHMISNASHASETNATAAFYSLFFPQLFDAIELLRRQSQPLAKFSLSSQEMSHNIFFTVRNNHIRPMLPSSQQSQSSATSMTIFDGPYKLSLARIPKLYCPYLPRMLEGGILGTDRVLSGLGKKSEDLLGLIWSLPCLLPQPLMALMPIKAPAASNVRGGGGGINFKLQLLMGMTLSSAMNFTKVISKPDLQNNFISRSPRGNESMKDGNPLTSVSSRFFQLKFPGISTRNLKSVKQSTTVNLGEDAEPMEKDRLHYEDAFSAPLEMELIVHTVPNEGNIASLASSSIFHRKQSVAPSMAHPNVHISPQQYEAFARKKFAEAVLVIIDQSLHGSSGSVDVEEGKWQFLSAKVAGLSILANSAGSKGKKTASRPVWAHDDDVAANNNRVFGHQIWQYSAKDLDQKYVPEGDNTDTLGDLDYGHADMMRAEDDVMNFDYHNGMGSLYDNASQHHHQTRSHGEQQQLQRRKHFLRQVAQAGEVIIDTMVLCPSSKCMLSAEDVYHVFAEVTGVKTKVETLQRAKLQEQQQDQNEILSPTRDNSNTKYNNKNPKSSVVTSPRKNEKNDVLIGNEKETVPELGPSPSADRMGKKFLRRATAAMMDTNLFGISPRKSELTPSNTKEEQDIMVEDVSDQETDADEDCEVQYPELDEAVTKPDDADDNIDEDVDKHTKNVLKTLNFLTGDDATDEVDFLLNNKEDEQELQHRAKIDPTFSDSTRLYGNLRDPSSLLQRKLTQKLSEKYSQAQLSSSVSLPERFQWLPVRLHVTCLLQQPPGTANTAGTNNSDNNKRHSFLHTHVHPSVSLSTISRLLTRTVYFSATSMQTLWQCLAPIQQKHPQQQEVSFSRGRSLATATALQVMSLRRSIEHMYFRAGGSQHSYHGHTHAQDLASLGRLCIDYYLLTQQVHPCDHFLHIYRKGYESYVNELYHLQTLLSGLAEQWQFIITSATSTGASKLNISVSVGSYIAAVHTCQSMLEGIFRSPYCASVTVHLRGLAAVVLVQFQRLFEQWYAPNPTTFAQNDTSSSSLLQAEEEVTNRITKSYKNKSKQQVNINMNNLKTKLLNQPMISFNQQQAFDESALISSGQASTAPPHLTMREEKVDKDEENVQYQFVYEDTMNNADISYTQSNISNNTKNAEAIQTIEAMSHILSSSITHRAQILLALFKTAREEGGLLSDIAQARIQLAGQILTEIAQSLATMVHVIAQDAYAEFCLHPMASSNASNTTYNTTSSSYTTYKDALYRLLFPSDVFQQERRHNTTQKQHTKLVMYRAFRSSVEAFLGYFGTEHFLQQGTTTTESEDHYSYILFPAIVSFAQRAQRSQCHSILLRDNFHSNYVQNRFHWQGLVHQSLDGLETIHLHSNNSNENTMDLYNDSDDELSNIALKNQENPNNNRELTEILDQSLFVAKQQQQQHLTQSSSTASFLSAKNLHHSKTNLSNDDQSESTQNTNVLAAKRHVQMIRKVFKALQPPPTATASASSNNTNNTTNNTYDNNNNINNNSNSNNCNNNETNDHVGENGIKEATTIEKEEKEEELRTKKSVSWLLQKLKTRTASNSEIDEGDNSSITDDQIYSETTANNKNDKNNDNDKGRDGKNKWDFASTVHRAQQTQNLGHHWLQQQRSHTKEQAAKAQQFANMLSDPLPKSFLQNNLTDNDTDNSDVNNNNIANNSIINNDKNVSSVPMKRFQVDATLKAAAESFSVHPPAQEKAIHQPPSMLTFLRAYHTGHIHDAPMDEFSYNDNSALNKNNNHNIVNNNEYVANMYNNDGDGNRQHSIGIGMSVPLAVPASSDWLLHHHINNNMNNNISNNMKIRTKVDPSSLFDNVSSSSLSLTQNNGQNMDMATLSPLSQFRRFAQQQSQQEKMQAISELLSLHQLRTKQQRQQQPLHLLNNYFNNNDNNANNNNDNHNNFNNMYTNTVNNSHLNGNKSLYSGVNTSLQQPFMPSFASPIQRVSDPELLNSVNLMHHMRNSDEEFQNTRRVLFPPVSHSNNNNIPYDSDAELDLLSYLNT